MDTAGIRRRGKVRHTVERLSVDRARRNIERADVVILVLDGTSDIAGYITDAFKPLLVVVNKWDLVDEREEAARRWLDDIRYRFRFAKEAPIAWISAKTGQRVATLLGRVTELWEQAGRWIPTSELNRWVEQVKGIDGSAPAGARGFRLYYATQTGVHPPTVLLFCNDPEKLHFSLRRHLENRLREGLGFGAAPIRLEFRARPK